jgi:hypothetical protein
MKIIMSGRAVKDRGKRVQCPTGKKGLTFNVQWKFVLFSKFRVQSSQENLLRVDSQRLRV